MKYYSICRKILGNDIFNILVNDLLNRITNKFGKNINIEEFVRILEIHINVLIMLAISINFPHKKNEILKEIKKSEKYLITKTINSFEKDMEYYINQIAKNM